MQSYIYESQIEKSAIMLLTEKLRYRHSNCKEQDGTGRVSEEEVVIRSVLEQKVRELNPGLPEKVLKEAVKAVTKIDRYSALADANREMLNLLRQGVLVKFAQPDGKSRQEFVKVIDWENPQKNDFLVASQLWIRGINRLRPDLIIFVNGIPLVTIELKNSSVTVENAYRDNLTRYRRDIPNLFIYNAFLIISNGIETRVGSTFASWEYYFPWLRVDDEKQKIDKERIQTFGCSLDYAILGILAPEKLTDYVENFILFYKGNKICAKNHQFLGVNHAFERFVDLQKEDVAPEEKGKLGVFWHTQGSGKSFSMVFLARKIKRKLEGHYTFLIVTDREDLDDQIYRNFLHAGFVTKSVKCRPKNSRELREMLTENKDCLFTLIQKFRYDKKKEYPLLSERKDIIVFVDEAHRTQYKDLAENMRAGLPNAQFMAFTGTPLFGSKQLTNEWFGSNVSEYNFIQAVQDGATLPLFYQKRLPEVQLENVTFQEDFLEIINSEGLSDDQQERLEKEYARELSVLRSQDRLKKIARDVVSHFIARGYLGKGMVIAVDKFSTVRLYNWVQLYWKEAQRAINMKIAGEQDKEEQKRLMDVRDWMRETQMAVVVSEEAGEDEKFAEEGLSIKEHREKMKLANEEGQDLEGMFKDPAHPLRLVFVCAMWLTGFDAPTVSTLYLDKPMKDHSLMQTIARANRVTDFKILGQTKECGIVIDYCNVFGRLKKALSCYAEGHQNMPGEDEAGSELCQAVKKTDQLFVLLQQAIDECVGWCEQRGVDLKEILNVETTFSKIGLFDEYADRIIGERGGKLQFCLFDNAISALYEACRPEIISRKHEFVLSKIIHYLREVIDGKVDRGNMQNARRRIKNLLDESLIARDVELPVDLVLESADSYGIKSYQEVDLSRIDMEKLREEYKKAPFKNVEIEDLRQFLETKMRAMLAQNILRRGFLERLQAIIDRYNAGSSSREQYFDDLMDFIEVLTEEEQRATREGLTEEELEIFDLIRKDGMTQEETLKVKLAARELMASIRKQQKSLFVYHWYKEEAKRKKLLHHIGDVLNVYLPETYKSTDLKEKSLKVFNSFMTKVAEGRMRA